jgi:SPP1 gp7 family putative phage head morphogenesis protein
MNLDTSSSEDKSAFEVYMRTGIPIEHTIKELTLKESGASEKKPTHYYIWRTRNDGKVRPEHAVNNGKIFAWNDPPATGHPGESFGCRCRAEPYSQTIAEYFDIQFTGISDASSAWTNLDFIHHYFFGDGKTVRLRETGHLTGITDRYREIVIDDASRLPSKIANKSRVSQNQYFSGDFKNSYDFINVLFSFGRSVISGNFFGYCKNINGALHLNGSIRFYFSDKFEDISGIRRQLNLLDEKYQIKQFGELPFSTIYEITDSWQGTFKAVVHFDPDRSSYAKN